MRLKSKNKAMKCFIASAFNHEDVDAIYDKVIVRVLNKIKIVPLRVDREEHNDDIDDKIYQLLHSADFCIADLTYARPSAYYEAGYAYGKGKPVIYTVRADHLKRNFADESGNLKVHFDLQMKNIISWSKPDDVFAGRLAKRIQVVCQPLFLKAAEEARCDDARFRFNRLSLENKLESLRLEFSRRALNSGFKFRQGDPDSLSRKRFDFYYHNHGRTLQAVHFFAIPKITKAAIQDIAYPTLRSKYSSIPHKKILRYLLIASPGGVSPNALTTYLQSWDPLNENEFGRRIDEKYRSEAAVVRVWDRVQSADELFTQLDPYIKSIAFNSYYPIKPVAVH